MKSLDRCDFALRKDLLPLLEAHAFDSAIRKAMVVLKTRVCNKLNLTLEIDGQDLVNKVFGRNTVFVPHLSELQREACRGLFAGLYALIRNRYMHNDEQPTSVELDAVISNVNLFLQVVRDFHLHAFDILVVDGDQPLRQLITDRLAAHFAVRQAACPSDAKLICQSVGFPTVLVTDRYFAAGQKEKGEDLASFIRLSDAECPVIYTFDYPSDGHQHSLNTELINHSYSTTCFRQ